MKKILSLILVCVLMTFSISALSNDSQTLEGDNAQELKDYRIMQGDPDGNMRLEDELTRAEAVTLLVRLYGYETAETEVVTLHWFSDMEGHWACNNVMLAKKLGIADGTSETTFSPDEKITAQEFLKMIVCLLGYKEVAEQRAGYPVGYIMMASQLGMTSSVPLITDKTVTRGQAAKIICNSLDIPLMVQTSYGENNEYAIMDGKNGYEYRTLRTELEK